MSKHAIEATWARLEHHAERVCVAAQDLRTAVALRRVPRVAAALQTFMSTTADSMRLLGRLDQDLEDRETETE
jgi:hypothetical protein